MPSGHHSKGFIYIMPCTPPSLCHLQTVDQGTKVQEGKKLAQGHKAHTWQAWTVCLPLERQANAWSKALELDVTTGQWLNPALYRAGSRGLDRRPDPSKGMGLGFWCHFLELLSGHLPFPGLCFPLNTCSAWKPIFLKTTETRVEQFKLLEASHKKKKSASI